MAGTPANEPDDRIGSDEGRNPALEERPGRYGRVSGRLQRLLRDRGPTDPGERSDSNEQHEADVDLDELLEVLSNRRRRYFWRFLRDRSGAVEISEASRHVAAWEEDVAPDELTYEDRKSVYTSLYQHHAPLLDDAGLIEFDKDEASARSVTAVEREYVVETGLDETDMLLRFAGGVLIAIGLVSTLWTLGVGPFGGASMSLLLVSIVIGVLVTALVYLTLVTQTHRVRFMDVLSDIDTVE